MSSSFSSSSNNREGEQSATKRPKISDTDKLVEITNSLGFKNAQDHKKVDEFSDALRSKSIVLYNVKKNKKRLREISDTNKNTSQVVSMWPSQNETVPTITALLDLHRIWLSDYYVLSRESSKSVALMRGTLANLDLRGAKIVVLESKTRSCTGQIGIVTAATQNQLHLCIYDPSYEAEDVSSSIGMAKSRGINREDHDDDEDRGLTDPAELHSSSKHGYASSKLAHGWEDRYENLFDLQGLALGTEVMRKYKGKLRVVRVIKSQSIYAVCIPRTTSSTYNSSATTAAFATSAFATSDSYVDQIEVDEAEADGLFQLRENDEDMYISPSSSCASS